jgi:hypothetical protein
VHNDEYPRYKGRGDRTTGNSGPPSTGSSDLTIGKFHSSHTMKYALPLVFLSTFAFASHGIVHQHRCTSEVDTTASTNDGWGQAHSGNASFTEYWGCNTPCKLCVYFRGLVLHRVHADRDVFFAACGITTSGYTAAVNTFAFGANSASGDACGRCFNITSNEDPYSPSYSGPFKSIVVRVSNLCPINSNEEWCGQTASKPLNQHGTSMQCVTLPFN